VFWFPISICFFLFLSQTLYCNLTNHSKTRQSATFTDSMSILHCFLVAVKQWICACCWLLWGLLLCRAHGQKTNRSLWTLKPSAIMSQVWEYVGIAFRDHRLLSGFSLSAKPETWKLKPKCFSGCVGHDSCKANKRPTFLFYRTL